MIKAKCISELSRKEEEKKLPTTRVVLSLFLKKLLIVSVPPRPTQNRWHIRDSGVALSFHQDTPTGGGGALMTILIFDRVLRWDAFVNLR